MLAQTEPQIIAFDQPPPAPASDAPPEAMALYSLFAVKGIHRTGRLTRAAIADYIKKYYGRKIPEREIAKIAGRWLAVGIDDYMNWWRVYDACRLLADGCDITAVQTALRVSNRANFTRLFRHIAHMTPSEYRSRLVHSPHPARSTPT